MRESSKNNERGKERERGGMDVWVNSAWFYFFFREMFTQNFKRNMSKG